MRKPVTTDFNIRYPIVLFITAVCLTLLITTGQVNATSYLFQSPPAEPAEEQTEPRREEPPAQEQEQQAPTETQPSPAETQPDDAPVDSAPTQAEPTLPPTSEESVPIESQAQPPPPESRQLDTTADEDGSRGFIFDRAEFIDTILIFGSYIWACCGLILLLSVPLFLLLLQIRGSSKLRKKKRNQQPF